MLYGLILLTHIALALFTGALILYILAAVSLNHAHSYLKLAKILGGVAAAQIFTGTILAMLSPELSATALSMHVLTYLGICGAVEGLLLYKMRVQAFPVFNVAYPVCLSVFGFGLAVVLGF